MILYFRIPNEAPPNHWSAGPKLHTEKFTEITFSPLDQKWSFSMLKITEIIPGTMPAAPPPLAEAFQIL